jgi:integrating conjugative element protein (TIGR03761 family)
MSTVIRSKRSIPPRLKITVELRVQTLNAQHYVWGKQRGVLGLFQFAKRVSHIVQAAAQDDPFADQVLIRLSDQLVSVGRCLEKKVSGYEALLANHKNKTHKAMLSNKAVIIPLQFFSAFGYMAADMISAYDRALSALLMAKSIGLCTQENLTTLVQSFKAMIDPVLNLPLHWHFTGVTRADVKQQTEPAQQAMRWMGTLPDSILNAEPRQCYTLPVYAA